MEPAFSQHGQNYFTFLPASDIYFIVHASSVATVSKLSILFRHFKNSYCLEIFEFFKALCNFPITAFFLITDIIFGEKSFGIDTASPVNRMPKFRNFTSRNDGFLSSTAA
jgi:hypothetical protein